MNVSGYVIRCEFNRAFNASLNAQLHVEGDAWARRMWALSELVVRREIRNANAHDDRMADDGCPHAGREPMAPIDGEFCWWPLDHPAKAFAMGIRP